MPEKRTCVDEILGLIEMLEISIYSALNIGFEKLFRVRYTNKITRTTVEEIHN